MPGVGKSGNCLKEFFSFILRLESSAALAEAEGASLPWALLAAGGLEEGTGGLEEEDGRPRDGSEVGILKKSGSWGAWDSNNRSVRQQPHWLGRKGLFGW